MRSTLAGRQRSVPLAFALVIAIIAGVFAFTTQRESAHAGVLGHDHSVGPVGLPTAAEVAFRDQMLRPPTPMRAIAYRFGANNNARRRSGLHR
jgi:hypothetical protein